MNFRQTRERIEHHGHSKFGTIGWSKKDYPSHCTSKIIKQFNCAYLINMKPLLSTKKQNPRRH